MDEIMVTKKEKKEHIINDTHSKLKKLFENADKKPKILKPEKKKVKKEEKYTPHIVNIQTLTGNLTKGTETVSDGSKIDMTYYSVNGWNYLGSEDAKANRKIYNGKSPQKGEYHVYYDGFLFYNEEFQVNFNPSYTNKKINTDVINAELDKEFYNAEYTPVNGESISGKKDRIGKKSYLQRAMNFGNKTSTYVGQGMPYKWQAHHILPMESFTTYFSPEEINIILLSDYDINLGENIIFLPARKYTMRIHQLPGHWSNHQEYTCKLEEKYDSVKDLIEEIKDDEKPCEKNMAKLSEEELHKIEDDQFDLLVNLGPSGRLT